MTSAQHKRIKLHRILGLSLLLLSNLLCYSQNSNEKVYIHINQNILISGSDLKYTAYISNEENTDLSSVVYFQLSNAHGETEITWTATAKNNCISGSMLIPDNLQNGIYHLQAYTYKMKNYPEKAIHTIPILIQSIHENANDNLISISAENTEVSQTYINESLLDIKVESGDELTISFKPDTKLQTAQLSISVTEVPGISAVKLPATFKEYLNTANSVPGINKKAPIEQEFSLLSGRILQMPDSTPLANKLVYLSVMDSTVHFKYFRTTADGEFVFLLDSNLNNKQLYLQVKDLTCNKDSIIWLIDNKDLPKRSPHTNDIIELSDSDKSYIQLLQKREVIDRVYNTNKVITSVSEPNKRSNFFYKPDYIIKPSDYVELNNFQDICENIIPSVRYRMNNNVVQLGIVINQQVIYDDVLICVNGLPCFNMKYIENLSPKNIKQIEVFNSTILHKDLTFNGVISIFTYKKEIDESMFCTPFYTFKHQVNTYQEMKPDSLQDNNSPMVSPNVYWNSNYKITGKSTSEISIQKPELGTKYYISINGLINQTIPLGFIQTIKTD